MKGGNQSKDEATFVVSN